MLGSLRYDYWNETYMNTFFIKKIIKKKFIYLYYNLKNNKKKLLK